MNLERFIKINSSRNQLAGKFGLLTSCQGLSRDAEDFEEMSNTTALEKACDTGQFDYPIPRP